MIDVTPEQLSLVTNILAQFVPECEVRAFGSRVNGTPKPYSDLDLAVIGKEKIPIRTLGLLREAFEACELPFRVDILDWNAITESFQNVIEQNYEIITMTTKLN